MTIPNERLEELRRLAAASGVVAPADPEELGRLSIRALMEKIGSVVPPDRPEVDVRLHGPGVPGHEIPVREAAGILTSIQEAISSIGQALRRAPTLHGVIQAQILQATELRLLPEIGAGSVVFSLIGAGEDITGDEAPGLTGTDTLVDVVMTELFSVIEQSHVQGAESSQLAQYLRRLGPRTAKHLSDLVRQIVGDEIDVDLSWRNPGGQRRLASLERQSALALGRAIDLNKIETRIVQLIGILSTVSTDKKAELKVQGGSAVRMTADKALAATLGPFFNQRVTARVEQTTTWSTNTGKETQTFRLLGLEMPPPERPEHATDG